MLKRRIRPTDTSDLFDQKINIPCVLDNKTRNSIVKERRFIQLTHLDCFSGPGGICTGFKAAGISTVAAIEKVESCAETYTKNHPSVKILRNDIRNISKDEIKKIAPNGIDIITAGMPCETFSTAGSSSRSFYDHRQILFLEPIRLASALNAKVIMFENVPGILTKKLEKGRPELVVNILRKELTNAGYIFQKSAVLNACNYGAAQSRERFFLIASKEDFDYRFPSVSLSFQPTVKDAFEDLPKIQANQGDINKKYLSKFNAYISLMRDNAFWGFNSAPDNPSYHAAPNHRPNTLERFKLIEPGEGLKNLFFKYPEEKVKELQQNGILPRKWFIQRNRRLVLNNVSATITSHCLDELVHPTLNRALTVREVARLQSFPDAYDFCGGPYICPHIYETQDKYEQVGDAVPPLLSYYLAKSLINCIKTK
jgi:DNA (cytosine-5)-methyltransferase 1